MQKLTVEQYEYLMAKVNELAHLIDMAKVENAPNKIIQQFEKKLMELENRISSLVSVN
jgi:hypothetical protein